MGKITLTTRDEANNWKVVPIKRFSFSGGESQIRIDGLISEVVMITAHVQSSEDLVSLLLLTDAARRHGAACVDLVLPYLPYARQDRVCAPGEALSLRVVCDLINAQCYNRVEVWDAHSDVALALLDRVVNRHCADFVRAVLEYEPQLFRPILVAPDAGAIKKVHTCARSNGLDYIRADKTRDPETGEITGTVVYSESTESDFLIVDDICDGGRTFIELAKELRKLTSGDINLYVTHGIFSKGTAVFDGVIDHVYVANPFSSLLPVNFTHIKA